MTVNGTPATVKADNSFEGKAAVTAGDNTVTVTATDANGNATTNRYKVTVSGSGTKTFVYLRREMEAMTRPNAFIHKECKLVRPTTTTRKITLVRYVN